VVKCTANGIEVEMKATLSLTGLLLLLLAPGAWAQAALPTDVPADHWAAPAVASVIDKGLMRGYPDGTFGGERIVSRYELAQVMHNLLQRLAQQRGLTLNELLGREGGPSGPPRQVTEEQPQNPVVEYFGYTPATEDQVRFLAAELDTLEQAG